MLWVVELRLAIGRAKMDYTAFLRFADDKTSICAKMGYAEEIAVIVAIAATGGEFLSLKISRNDLTISRQHSFNLYQGVCVVWTAEFSAMDIRPLHRSEIWARHIRLFFVFMNLFPVHY